MAEPRWLTPAEDRAWRGYRRLRLLLDARVNRDLMAESGLSEPDYDVLSNLSETPGHRWRLAALAQRMQWSRSRLSHHITRMQQRGLVRREDVASDGRGAYVVLTDGGLRAIQEAAPGHVESVRRHFIDRLSDGQVAAFGELADEVLAHLEPASGEPER